MTPHYPCCERTQLHAGWNLSLRRATVRTTYGRNHVGLGPGTQCQNTDDKLFESHIRAHHEKIRRNELKSEQGSQIIVEFQKMSEIFRARKMPAPLLKAAGERASSFGKCKACSFGATSHLRFLHLQCKGIHHRNMEHR